MPAPEGTPHSTSAFDRCPAVPLTGAVRVRFGVAGPGDLTVHGTTKQVTVDLTARSRGDIFSINGEVPIVMADYGIEPPSVPGMLDVDDHGSLEFIVNFEKS